MVHGNKILGLITARGGSRELPKKNIKKINGKPLIAWTIDAARRSQYIDSLILSSDDDEIIKIALDYGCEAPFVRPKHLAQDDTPGIEPVMHALSMCGSEYEYVVLLQPTSPLRSAEDIDNCIFQCIEQQAPACVSVTEADKSPYWMYTLDVDGCLHSLLNDNRYNQRQNLPPVYALNGAIYMAECKWLQSTQTFVTSETIAYIMPRDRSFDIDTELDFEICKFLLQTLTFN